MTGAHWTRTVDPASGNEPVSRTEAKLHLRVDTTADDTLIDGLIIAAREHIERVTGRGLFTQTWKYTQDDWTDELWLPMAAPLQSVTSVKYYASDGTLTTLTAADTYIVDTVTEPGRVIRKPDTAWPTLQSDRPARIEVTYVVGWSAVASMPQPLKQAALLLVGHWYANREAVGPDGVAAVPIAADALLGPYRVFWREPVCGWPV